MSSSGAYRHLLHFPKHIQWRITRNGERNDKWVKCRRDGGKESDIIMREGVCGIESRSEGDEDERGGTDGDQGSEDNSRSSRTPGNLKVEGQDVGLKNWRCSFLYLHLAMLQLYLESYCIL